MACQIEFLNSAKANRRVVREATTTLATTTIDNNEGITSIEAEVVGSYIDSTRGTKIVITRQKYESKKVSSLIRSWSDVNYTIQWFSVTERNAKNYIVGFDNGYLQENGEIDFRVNGVANFENNQLVFNNGLVWDKN